VIVLIAENCRSRQGRVEMTGADLDKDLGRCVQGDGAATTLAGAFGGAGTTTYAENIGRHGSDPHLLDRGVRHRGHRGHRVRACARSSECWSARSRPVSSVV
jgi:hypothetical protein